MSLNYNQIIGRIERTCGFNTGDITNNAQRKADFTDAMNVAQDEVFSIIFNKVNNGWQFDDTTHEDYPIIKTDLIQGQRDYSFTNDEQGNAIIDIFKVIIYDVDGNPHELPQVDRFGKSSDNIPLKSFSTDEQGTPSRYDSLGNGIFLDKIPAFFKENGLEVYISREGSYFATLDTTKKPGFNGLYHEYLVLRPAYEYARDKSLANTEQLKRDLNEMRDAIEKRYGNRGRGLSNSMTPVRENNR